MNPILAILCGKIICSVVTMGLFGGVRLCYSVYESKAFNVVLALADGSEDG